MQCRNSFTSCKADATEASGYCFACAEELAALLEADGFPTWSAWRAEEPEPPLPLVDGFDFGTDGPPGLDGFDYGPSGPPERTFRRQVTGHSEWKREEAQRCRRQASKHRRAMRTPNK